MKRLQSQLSHDKDIIQRTNASIAAAKSEVSRVRHALSVDQSLMQNETSVLESLRKKLSVSEVELKALSDLSMQANRSLGGAIVRTRATQKEVASHESAVKTLHEEIQESKLAATRIAQDAKEAEALVQDGFTTVSRLQNSTEILSKDVDDEQRFYMEEMAEASELTRRLNDFVRRVADAESSRGRVIADIAALKAQVGASQSGRERLTRALGVEVRVHNDFIDKSSDIESYLDKIACTT